MYDGGKLDGSCAEEAGGPRFSGRDGVVVFLCDDERMMTSLYNIFILN